MSKKIPAKKSKLAPPQKLNGVKAKQESFPGIEDSAKLDAPVNPAVPLTVNRLSEITKVDRRTVKHWLDRAGLVPIATDDLGNRESPVYEPFSALEVIYKNKRDTGKIDQENGGSVYNRWMLARAIDQERENRIKDMLEHEQYMEVAKVEKAFILLMGKLDSLMVKLQSRFGLPEAVVKAGNNLIDEVRAEAAKEISGIEEEKEAKAA